MQGYGSTDHQALEERKRALFELMYLVLVAGLYVGALVMPLFGLVVGIYVWVFGKAEATEHVGKVTTICGIIGLLLVVGFFLAWLFLFGALAALGSS